MILLHYFICCFVIVTNTKVSSAAFISNRHVVITTPPSFVLSRHHNNKNILKQPPTHPLTSHTLSFSTETLSSSLSSSASSSSPLPAPTIPPSPLAGIKSIGIDYGLARTGIAVTVGYAPLPLIILNSTNTTTLTSQIISLCEKEIGTTRLVVGLPLHKNGTLSLQAKLTLDFASVLACACHARFGPGGIRVELWDERYTSKEATARLMGSKKAGDFGGAIDAESACLILEHYYAVGGEGATRVGVPEEMMDVCERAWQVQRRENEKRREEVMKEREGRFNSRSEMMERVRRMEEEGMVVGGEGKKKKKKKKRKR